MPIELGDDRAVLSGVCAVEEAEGLLAWVLQHPGAPVETAACNHLHSAVLQVLMACRPPLASLPDTGPLRQIFESIAPEEATAA